MGACVGPKGARVQSIVNELKNEKIDIIKWNKAPEEFIANSLSPAKVLEVVVNEDNKTCKVVVDDNQLSLAIGKEGQNVRLAAKLTNWKIDIKNKTQKDAQDAEEERILNTEVEIENENTTDLSELEILDDIEVNDSNEDDSIEKIEE